MPRLRPVPVRAVSGGSPAALVALLLVGLLAGCTSGALPPSGARVSLPPTSAAPAVSPAATFPLTLTDDEGNAVALKAAPQRIVSLTPAATETLFAIGVGDRVVGKVQDVADYPPAAHALPEVATFEGVDVEKIVALRADLVIGGGNGLNKADQLQKLRDVGIPVLVVYAKDVAGVLADIRLIGKAVGADKAAGDLAASMRAQIDQIAAATAGLPHPRTFYEIDATKDIFGPADGSFLVEEITLAGGAPITTGSTTAFSIPLEKLVAADPEVIVLGDSAYGTTAAIVAARPGWSGMTAVKTHALRPIDDIVVSRPGPRLVAGLRALAMAIHPGLVWPGPAATPVIGVSIPPPAIPTPAP